jgi:hypothetical protein
MKEFESLRGEPTFAYLYRIVAVRQSEPRSLAPSPARSAARSA